MQNNDNNNYIGNAKPSKAIKGKMDNCVSTYSGQARDEIGKSNMVRIENRILGQAVKRISETVMEYIGETLNKHTAYPEINYLDVLFILPLQKSSMWSDPGVRLDRLHHGYYDFALKFSIFISPMLLCVTLCTKPEKQAFHRSISSFPHGYIMK